MFETYVLKKKKPLTFTINVVNTLIHWSYWSCTSCVVPLNLVLINSEHDRIRVVGAHHPERPLSPPPNPGDDVIFCVRVPVHVKLHCGVAQRELHLLEPVEKLERRGEHQCLTKWDWEILCHWHKYNSTYAHLPWLHPPPLALSKVTTKSLVQSMSHSVHRLIHIEGGDDVVFLQGEFLPGEAVQVCALQAVIFLGSWCHWRLPGCHSVASQPQKPFSQSPQNQI